MNFDKLCGNKVREVLISSPIGDINVISCQSGLHSITLNGSRECPNLSVEVKLQHQTYPTDIQAINDTIDWLKIYFESPKSYKLLKAPDFCPLIKRSEFHEKVWHTLRDKTPFGHKISYSDLAYLAGNPKASRAVGTAMKRNPFPLIVPCHRVVKKDGCVGNYGGGHHIKEWLLWHESRTINM